MKLLDQKTVELWRVDFYNEGRLWLNSWHATEAAARRYLKKLERQQKIVLDPPTGPGAVELIIIPTTKAGLIEWFNVNFSDGDLHATSRKTNFQKSTAPTYCLRIDDAKDKAVMMIYPDLYGRMAVLDGKGPRELTDLNLLELYREYGRTLMECGD